jgi:hypothetical protein
MVLVPIARVVLNSGLIAWRASDWFDIERLGSLFCCLSRELRSYDEVVLVLDMEILFVGFADSFCNAFRIGYSFCELI